MAKKAKYMATALSYAPEPVRREVVGRLYRDLSASDRPGGEGSSDSVKESAECSGSHTCCTIASNWREYCVLGNYTNGQTRANVNHCKIVSCGYFLGGTRVPATEGARVLGCHRNSIIAQGARANGVTEEEGFESARTRSVRVHGRDIGMQFDEHDFHTNKHHKVNACTDRALYSNRVTPEEIAAIVNFWNNPAHVVESPCRSDHIIQMVDGVKTKVC